MAVGMGLPPGTGPSFRDGSECSRPGAAYSFLLAFIGGDVVLGDKLVRDQDHLILLFLVGELDGGFHGTPALSLGVLKHRYVKVAGMHAGESIGRRIDAADADFLRIDARLLHGDQGADRHFVVVRGDSVDLRAGGDPIGHQVDGLAALIVGGLLLDHFDLRIFGDDFLVAGRTLGRGVTRQFAQHNGDVALAAHAVDKGLHLQAAGYDTVGYDDRDVFRQLLLVRSAVDIDQRNAGLLHHLGDAAGSGGIGRIDDDGGYAFGDEVLHLIDLAADIGLGILELDFDAGHGFGLCGHGFADVGQEVVIEQRHRDADAGIGRHGGRGENERRDASGKYALHWMFL